MNLPDNFDWVSARARCSPAEVLTHLESQVEEDIKKRVALLTESEKMYAVNFHFQRDRNQFSVWVIRDSERLGYAVFKPTSHGIGVQCLDTPDIVGILTLSNDGKCLLKVDDKEYSFWQFRKLTLEPLLFMLTKDLRQ